MIVDLEKNKLAMWMVCEAVASQHELIDKMDNIGTEGNEILKDIKFIVGGVELNFLNVIEAIDKNVTAMVNKEARELVEKKFDNLIEAIEEAKTIFEEKFDIE